MRKSIGGQAPVDSLVPGATGYGLAAPGRIWEAVAEVGGRLVTVHPRLDSGEMIEAQSTLLRIDPTEYELAVARLEAAVAETKANAVLLTSTTTIAGLLPLLFEKSLQAQILIPLVISTSFGLLASTVLVLLVIPCMYLILGDMGIVEKIGTGSGGGFEE